MSPCTWRTVVPSTANGMTIINHIVTQVIAIRLMLTISYQGIPVPEWPSDWPWVLVRERWLHYGRIAWGKSYKLYSRLRHDVQSVTSGADTYQLYFLKTSIHLLSPDEGDGQQTVRRQSKERMSETRGHLLHHVHLPSPDGRYGQGTRPTQALSRSGDTGMLSVQRWYLL